MADPSLSTALRVIAKEVLNLLSIPYRLFLVNMSLPICLKLARLYSPGGLSKDQKTLTLLFMTIFWYSQVNFTRHRSPLHLAIVNSYKPEFRPRRVGALGEDCGVAALLLVGI